MLCVFVVIFCRGLFIIDRKGILRQITMNDLSVSIMGIFHVQIIFVMMLHVHV